MTEDFDSELDFDNIYHDCETAENLFKQIPIQTLMKLYDTFRYITSLTTLDENENTTIITAMLTVSKMLT